MKNQIKIALLMATSLFMEILDGTIVTTALPQISKTFQATTSQASLLISIYLVTVAIFIPMSGWLAHYVGKKRVWMLAVALFTLSSLGSAFSQTLSFLIIMRILQGFSGALMTPTARLIVLEEVPANQMLKMSSYFIWPALIAPAIAPIIGGFFVTYFSWHWIFLINIPIGFIAFVIGKGLIAEDLELIKKKFDWLGFIEIAIASTFLLVGSELITSDNNPIVNLGIVLLILSLILGFITFYHLKNNKDPLFSLKALKTLSFRISQTSGSLLWMSVGAMPYLMTIYLQNIFHWSALVAGGFVIFIFIGNIGIKPFTTILIEKLSYRGALLSSFFLVLVSSVIFFFVEVTTPHIIIMILAFISGVGRSLALTAFNGLNLSEIEPKDRNGANTMNAVTSTLAEGLGVASVSLLIHVFNNFASISFSYRYSFVFLGLLMILPLIEIFKVPKNLGSQLS